MTEQTLLVEVAYALPDKQRIIALSVAPGTTARAAVEQSGIVQVFDELDLTSAKMGVFAKVLPNPDSYIVQDGDRIEIYRPLKADPKDVRKQRALKAKTE